MKWFAPILLPIMAFAFVLTMIWIVLEALPSFGRDVWLQWRMNTRSFTDSVARLFA